MLTSSAPAPFTVGLLKVLMSIWMSSVAVVPLTEKALVSW